MTIIVNYLTAGGPFFRKSNEPDESGGRYPTVFTRGLKISLFLLFAGVAAMEVMVFTWYDLGFFLGVGSWGGTVYVVR